MTQKELRKLKRPEMLDRLIEQEAVIEKLQLRVEEMETERRDRSIKIDQAGSLAEAALQVNGVIEATQKAADEYLENIKTLNERTTILCAQQEEECKARCQTLEAQTKRRCEDMEKATEQKISARWNEFSQKVDQYLEAHGELKEILKATVVSVEK